jgi:hypothetical protein
MAAAPDLDSARVSRAGAIWVAIITACGGFATAIVTGSFGMLSKSRPAPAQRWIHIQAVELTRDRDLPSVDRIRLIAQVNGVSYGYPTTVNSVWAPVGPGMPAERYPLPAGLEGYRIRFFAFGLDADGKIPRYEYRGSQEYAARQLPIRDATQPLQLTTSDPKGLKVGMTVRYSLE